MRNGDKMKNEYFNVSSVRLMRYLYALGFEKQSYMNKQNKENWRFKKSTLLNEALDFYFYARKINRELVECQNIQNTLKSGKLM